MRAARDESKQFNSNIQDSTNTGCHLCHKLWLEYQTEMKKAEDPFKKFISKSRMIRLKLVIIKYTEWFIASLK